MARTTLKVTGMTCGHCVQTVQRALEAVDGVRSARVDLASARALVDHDDARASAPELAAAVTASGYPAEPEG